MREAQTLAQMDARERVLYDQYLHPPDDQGVRAPLERKLRVFFPVHDARPSEAAADERRGEEEGEPQPEASLLLSAQAERTKRVTMASAFTSANARELARRRRLTVRRRHDQWRSCRCGWPC